MRKWHEAMALARAIRAGTIEAATPEEMLWAKTMTYAEAYSGGGLSPFHHKLAESNPVDRNTNIDYRKRTEAVVRNGEGKAKFNVLCYGAVNLDLGDIEARLASRGHDDFFVTKSVPVVDVFNEGGGYVASPRPAAKDYGYD